MSELLQHGTVKWFDPNKGFGFLTCPGQSDLFVHARNLDGRTELIEGQEVSFEIRPTPKGQEAVGVRVTRETHNPPRPRHAPRLHEGVPQNPVGGKVTTRDAQGRFLFVKADRDNQEVFVHNSLFRAYGRLGPGDRVRLTVEDSPRGLRATTLELL